MKDLDESIKELLNQIKKRPGVYLGKSDIFLLQAFLFGFRIALETLDMNERIIVPLDFHDWVAKKYHLNSSVAGWASIIYEREKESSVEKFFELLEEYKSENTHK
jgi:hypothetical protein